MQLPPKTDTLLLSTAYLPPVEYVAWVVQARQAYIEQYDSYCKQTYRNRCLIATANGSQALTIPVEKPAGDTALMRDIRISDHGNWRHLHWNALVSAYRSSPFFDYYADDFAPFYEKKYPFLLDFNEELLHLILRCMNLEARIHRTETFRPLSDSPTTPHPAISSSSTFETEEIPPLYDLREAIRPKHSQPTGFQARPYYQVFAQKQGFRPNLSSIDLLFHTGPESVFTLRDSILLP